MSGKEIIEQAKASVKAAKQPRTVRIKTVIISIFVFIALIGAFIGGIAYEKYDQARVEIQAARLIKSLK